MILNKINN